MDFTKNLLQHVRHKHWLTNLQQEKHAKLEEIPSFHMRLFQVNISVTTVVNNANFGRAPGVYRAILARARVFFPSHSRVCFVLLVR